MTTEMAFILAVYGVPCLIGAVMPGWRSLGLFAVFVLLIGVWTFQPRGGAGFDGVVEYVLGIFVFAGAATGLSGCAARLLIQRGGTSGAVPWLATLGIALVPPAIYAAMAPNGW